MEKTGKNIFPSKTDICSAQLANGEIKSLATDKLNGIPIPKQVNASIEGCRMKIEDDYCTIVLAAEDNQWGYTLVWGYVQDKPVHLTNTAGAVDVTVFGSRVVNMYLSGLGSCRRSMVQRCSPGVDRSRS